MFSAFRECHVGRTSFNSKQSSGCAQSICIAKFRPTIVVSYAIANVTFFVPSQTDTQVSPLHSGNLTFDSLNIKHSCGISPAGDIATTESYLFTYRSSLNTLWHIVLSHTVLSRAVPIYRHRSLNVSEVAYFSIVFMVLFIRRVGGSNKAAGNAVFGWEYEGLSSNWFLCFYAGVSLWRGEKGDLKKRYIVNLSAKLLGHISRPSPFRNLGSDI